MCLRVCVCVSMLVHTLSVDSMIRRYTFISIHVVQEQSLRHLDW